MPNEHLCKLYFFDLEKARSAMRKDGLDLFAPSESGTAARREEKPPIGKTGAFVADGLLGNFYQ